MLNNKALQVPYGTRVQGDGEDIRAGTEVLRCAQGGA